MTKRSVSRGVIGLRLALLVPLAFVGGCLRGCHSPFSPIHPNPNMDQQEKAEAQEASDFFYDGMTMRMPVEGTVALDAPLDPSDGFLTGRDAAGQYLPTLPIDVDDTVAARGAERYTIYCQPCHDARGNGRGILFEYGNVPTAGFHDEQRLAYTDGQFFDIITNGSGLMKGYEWPIPPADRWAIVAHVKSLQVQQQQAAAALAAQ